MKTIGKTMLVTGGGSGVGRALVLGLLEKGARVAAIDIDETALEETVELSNTGKDRLFTYVVDISSRSNVEEVVEQIISETGGVDGVINNAGIIQPFVKLNELDYEVIERVMSVNFWGTLYITKALLPHLHTREEAHIVNISSMGGFLPVPGQTIYGASKAAVKLMTEGLHAELADTQIQVTVVFPGAIDTNILENSGLVNADQSQNEQNSMPMLSAEEAAQQIIQGMEKNSYRLTIGKDATFMDYLYRLVPAYAARYINKKMKGLLSG